MADYQNLTLDAKLEAALLDMDRIAAHSLLKKMGTGSTLIQQVEQMIIPALERIGSSWEKGDLSLSQVYMSGRICEELVKKLSLGAERARPNQPKLAIAVLEDYHVLGKRMVYSTLLASGYSTLDFGRQDVDSLVRRVVDEEIEIVLISTLMLPSALRVAEVRNKLQQKGKNAKIVVGGAPFRFDRNLWREIGADAMGYNASDVVAVLADLTGGA